MRACTLIRYLQLLRHCSTRLTSASRRRQSYSCGGASSEGRRGWRVSAPSARQAASSRSGWAARSGSGSGSGRQRGTDGVAGARAGAAAASHDRRPAGRRARRRARGRAPKPRARLLGVRPLRQRLGELLVKVLRQAGSELGQVGRGEGGAGEGARGGTGEGVGQGGAADAGAMPCGAGGCRGQALYKAASGAAPHPQQQLAARHRHAALCPPRQRGTHGRGHAPGRSRRPCTAGTRQTTPPPTSRACPTRSQRRSAGPLRWERGRRGR